MRELTYNELENIHGGLTGIEIYLGIVAAAAGAATLYKLFYDSAYDREMARLEKQAAAEAAAQAQAQKEFDAWIQQQQLMYMQQYYYGS